MKTSRKEEPPIARTQRPMVEVLRSFAAKRLNELANHPDIRPFIADPDEGVLDLTGQVRNESNVLLLGEHGGCMLLKLTPALYEVHTLVRPEGRGPWALSMAKAVLRWMFCNTDACEVVTRVPHGHQAARTLSVAAGMKFELTRPDGSRFMGQVTPIDLYAITIQDWVQKDQMLEQIGARTHAEMREQAKKIGITEPPHEEDLDHNRIVGACTEMMIGGQLPKAVSLYNRWAQVARHKTIELVTLDPPTIRMDVGLIRLVSGKLEIVKC